MKIKFTKMHGCGNDYVYVDGEKRLFPRTGNRNWPGLFPTDTSVLDPTALSLSIPWMIRTSTLRWR